MAAEPTQGAAIARYEAADVECGMKGAVGQGMVAQAVSGQWRRLRGSEKIDPAVDHPGDTVWHAMSHADIPEAPWLSLFHSYCSEAVLEEREEMKMGNRYIVVLYGHVCYR